jgi:Tol biopolymer transport system component
VTLANLGEGPHTLELTGLSSNCLPTGSSTHRVTVAGGSGGEVRFEVVCTPPPELSSIRLVYVRWVRESSVWRSLIVAMNADGSDALRLTSGEFHDQDPDVSPDGKRIAFQSDREGDPNLGAPAIWIMNADGSGQIPLVLGPAYNPDWSPDGRRIAYVGASDHWGGPILVRDVDGGDTRALTTPDPFAAVIAEDASPAWSPDGTRLAFGRAELVGGTLTGIWVMNADGTGATRVTQSRLWGGMSPAWSPDGRRMAFTDFEGPFDSGTSRLKVMNADGTAVETLLEEPGTGVGGVVDWSGDGKYLLFIRKGDVHLLDLQSKGLVRLTADGAYAYPTFWPGPPKR